MFADSEDEVVALALEQWTSLGAALVALPPDKSWSAVIDGRDVAIAYPERNGDGRWTVGGVSTCGPPRTGPPLDGNLDCANESGWGQQGLINPTIPGLPTPGEALQSALDPFLERHGGEIVEVREGVASLVVEGPRAGCCHRHGGGRRRMGRHHRFWLSGIRGISETGHCGQGLSLTKDWAAPTASRSMRYG